MKVGLRSVQVSLWIVASVLGSLAVAVGTLPVVAQEEPARDEFLVLSDEFNARPDDLGAEVSVSIPQLHELEQPATTIEDWVAQIEASLVQITGVRVETTETGLQVILETKNGSLEVPETRAIGNALIADIPNATIAEEFSQAEPIEGIALVSVTSLPGDRVRVAITGTDASPVAEVTSEAQGLVLAVRLGDAADVAEEDAIQVVVTGEQDEGYNPSSASTATRTDTPLRDIPQSIQVVPRQVLDDRNVRTVGEAVETVSGVSSGYIQSSGLGNTNIIRGFLSEDSGTLRNGFQGFDYYSATSLSTIERIEVLRGPASVLFGAQEPGGVVNLITRQPLDEPYYNLAFEAGSYEFYQPSIDLSGPLTPGDDILYRFIASYQSTNSYQDFVDSSVTTVAPSLTFRFGERTDLNLSYEYVRYFSDEPLFEIPLLSDGSLPPRSFYPAYPDFVFQGITTHRIGATLNHRFSENWQLRNNLAFTFNQRDFDRMFFVGLVDDRILTDGQADEAREWAHRYVGQIDLLGRFNTGSISHQLLVGFDVNYFESLYNESSDSIPDLDIFNPNYDVPAPEYIPGRQFNTLSRAYGFYIQDQIAFSDNFRLLIGGRYDWIDSEFEILSDDSDQPVASDGAFSPRIGLVYQPSDMVSLYASYNRSFKPSIFGSSADGEAFEPTRGTQYEIGTRVNFLEGRLSANLAAYHLTRTNVLTPDPDNPEFSIQTGEARSQGIELDVTGEILPGWNVILAYAYTDAEVTEDNTIPIGNRLDNVPFNQASLWTTYEIQEGDLRGLGFGLGLFYVGERQVDLANSFELPSHIRTDAALYYRRDNFDAAINVRNLFDIDYVSYASGTSFVQRGAPFTITGSVSWTF